MSTGVTPGSVLALSFGRVVQVSFISGRNYSLELLFFFFNYSMIVLFSHYMIILLVVGSINSSFIQSFILNMQLDAGPTSPDTDLLKITKPDFDIIV